MKMFFIFLLAMYFLSEAVSAQPVMINSEFYNVGDVITMVNCDPSTVSAGPAGASVHQNRPSSATRANQAFRAFSITRINSRESAVMAW